MRPFFFASSKAVRRTFSGCASSGWMIASSSWSIAGPAAAPVSAFTLKPLSVHGLWLAVITIPAFAFRRIVAHANGDAGERDERLEDLADRDRAAGPDVERAAFAQIQRCRVRARHVADVQEVALGVEATVPHDGSGDPRLGLRDLLRERRRREPGVLSRAVLIGRTQDDDRRSVTRRKLPRQRFGRDFRGGIDVARPYRRVLVHRHAVLRSIAVGAGGKV